MDIIVPHNQPTPHLYQFFFSSIYFHVYEYFTFYPVLPIVKYKYYEEYF